LFGARRVVRLVVDGHDLLAGADREQVLGRRRQSEMIRAGGCASVTVLSGVDGD
jgi:hypothetical protein